MNSTSRRVQVHLAEAPTDVLVWLAGQHPATWAGFVWIAHEVPPPGTVDAAESTAGALRTLLDAGYAEGQRIDGSPVFRATDAGRAAVAEALAQAGEVSGG